MLSVFNYSWKVACVRSNEERKFKISAELTSRYFFEDKHILTVYLKNNDEILLTKELSLDKYTGKIEFEIEFLEEWSVPFEKIKVSAFLWVKDVQYYRSDWATEYDFKDKNRPHDVVLVAAETKFYMFRNYLATWSRFFDRLFYGNFKEKNQKEINLEDVDAIDFERILRYINPQLLWKLDESDVLEILKLADRFEIPNLMARCGEILCEFDDYENLEVLDRLELADNHNLVSLQIACFECIHKMEEKDRAQFFDKNRRHEKLLAVLKLADRFEIPSLIVDCGVLLSNFESYEEVDIMERLELADNHQMVHLQTACFDYIRKMSDVDRKEFFENNRLRIRQLSNGTLKNLF